MTDWNAVIDGDFRLPEGLSPRDAVAELTGMLRDPNPAVRDELAYTVLDRLIPDLDVGVCIALGDDAAHVLPHVANMIGVLQALYVFADRGARRTWGGPRVLALPDAGQLKARIGDVLRSALPYSA